MTIILNLICECWLKKFKKKVIKYSYIKNINTTYVNINISKKYIIYS